MTAQNYQLLTWDGSKQKRVNSETIELKLGKLSLAVLGDVEAAFAQEASDRAAGDAATLSSAQSYANAAVAAAVLDVTSDIEALQSDLAQEVVDRGAGDSATLASAQAYADQKITDLVGAAPATLDTLKEIADAIANDANIAATLTASIASTQAEVDAVEVALASETSAREAADSALDARVEDVETNLETSVVTVLENNAAVYADAQPAIQDPSFREGWYFKNAGPVGTAQNKVNWYFFDGTSENISLGDFSGYAVVTFDSLVSKPHLAVYTTPTGSGDAAAWYKSRVVYIANQTPLAGVKYLMYFGQDPKVHPELPRLTMAADNVSTQGSQGAGERVLFSVIGSDGGAAIGNCEFVAEAVGVFSPNIKRKIEFKIRKASKAALDAESSARSAQGSSLQSNIDAEQAAREAADSTLQSNINTVSAGLAQELLDRAAAVSAEQSRAETAEAGLQSDIDAVAADLAQELLDRASGDSTLQGNIDTVSAGLAQELLDRASADTALQGEIDTVEANLAQELLDRASADSALQSSIDDVAADLAQELLDRASAVSAVQAEVDAEEVRAAAAEAALQAEIDAEETRALAAEAVIQGEVDALELVVGDIKLLSKVASEAISAGEICYIKADGTVAKAGATVDLSDAHLLIASESIASGASGKLFVVEGSVVGGFSSLTPGKKYFVSASTAGSVVDSTAGFSSGNSVYTVGRAVSTTQISFAPVFEFEY
ncbi:MAG: hypothetical protein ACO39F_02905 [Candidatus Nanopelagicaceae bacterium]